MRYSLVVGWLVVHIVGCAGSVSKPGDNSGAAGAAPVVPTVPAASESLDDPSGIYPDAPGNGSAFFWRWGLGNWFVARSDGTHRDATYEALATGKVWKAPAELGGATDLWAQLNHPSGKPIDLSAYQGMTFDARLVDGAAQLVVALSAGGDLSVAERTSAAQRFELDETWRSYALDFGEGGASAAVSSFDFVVATPRSAGELQVRNVALSCNATCP